MKVLAFLYVLTVVGCIPASNDGVWEQYKIDFSKSYETPDEEAYRKSVYLDNKKIVEEHNARFRQGLESFDLELNRFADMTVGEFSSRMKGLIQRESSSDTEVFIPDPEFTAKGTVDWRTKGAVTKVRDQGNCGSCWAFSATGSLEGQHFLKTGKLVTLSVQNLIDCSSKYGNHGCMGGLPDQAFQYIKANGGIDTFAAYQYEARNGNCRYDPKGVGATITGYKDLPEGDEKALQEASAKIGPISVGIDASSVEFQLYNSGVFNYPNCSSKKLDHAVVVVGYGEAEDSPYWLVKNSWGTDWGENGYALMSRDKDNQCGIATQASYPMV